MLSSLLVERAASGKDVEFGGGGGETVGTLSPAPAPVLARRDLLPREPKGWLWAAPLILGAPHPRCPPQASLSHWWVRRRTPAYPTCRYRKAAWTAFLRAADDLPRALRRDADTLAVTHDVGDPARVGVPSVTFVIDGQGGAWFYATINVRKDVNNRVCIDIGWSDNESRGQQTLTKKHLLTAHRGSSQRQYSRLWKLRPDRGPRYQTAGAQFGSVCRRHLQIPQQLE